MWTRATRTVGYINGEKEPFAARWLNAKRDAGTRSSENGSRGALAFLGVPAFVPVLSPVLSLLCRV